MTDIDAVFREKIIEENAKLREALAREMALADGLRASLERIAFRRTVH